MPRMNNHLTSKEAKKFMTLTMTAMDSRERVRRTPAAKQAAENDNRLTTSIIAAMDKASSIEELIKLEMVLQRLDKLTAETKQDRTGIENAEREYGQLAETVRQMRTVPQEYFKANVSIRETRGDFKALPKSRGLQQIQANKARMQNRASFAPAEQREVWEARAKLADKTESMLRTLHKNLAKNHECLLKIEEQQRANTRERHTQSRE